MSILIDLPSLGMSALRAEDLTLIFSRMGEAEAVTGSTSFVETDSLFARTFLRWALAFSLATAILVKSDAIRARAGAGRENDVSAPILPEHMFPPLLDLGDTFHGLHRGLDQVAVVAYWDVSALLELDGRVLR